MERWLRPDGRCDDPTGRVVGAEGLPSLAWSAFNARGDGDGDGDGAAARLALARATLARGSGATVLLRRPLAMLVADNPDELPAADRKELRAAT